MIESSLVVDREVVRSDEPTIDDHDVLGMIAEGGFGRVFLARNRRTEQFEALKVLRDEWSSDAEARQRFLREATNAAAVRHEHVVRIVDWGETLDGVPYLSMEYIEGPTVASVLRRVGTFPRERARAIAIGIAEALDAAHRLGIVHRDLKPSNILLATPHGGDPVVDGIPKVADFGLARVMRDPLQRVTRAGFTLGTLAYMSPEQLVSGELADARSDVFALGCVLFEMLTGTQAFGQDPLSRRECYPPSSLRALPSPFAESLEAVVRRSLERDPSSRFQSALDFRNALRCSRDRGANVDSPRWIRTTALALVISVGAGGREPTNPKWLERDAGNVANSLQSAQPTWSAPRNDVLPGTTFSKSRGQTPKFRHVRIPASGGYQHVQRPAVSAPVQMREDSIERQPDSATSDVFNLRTSGQEAERDQPKASVGTGFTVQFAALLAAGGADTIASGILVNGQRARVIETDVEGSSVYRVVLGPFATREDAERVARQSRRSYWIYLDSP